MIANDINILQKYNCILTEREFQASQIFTFDTWLEQSIDPVKLRDEKFKYAPITIKLLVEGNSEEEVLLKISNIIKDVATCELKFSDIKFSYNAFLNNHDEKLICETAYELTLEFKCTHKIKDEIVISITDKTHDVASAGNLEAPCILEITSSIDQIDARITGLTITPIDLKNIKAHQTIIINAIDGLVTEGVSNKFNDIDIWEYPSVKPGANHITINKDNINIKLKYKPRFI